MKTPFIAFFFIALIGLGIMAVIGYDSSATGQGTRITIPKEMLKKVTEEKTPPSTPQSNKCECENPYEGKIIVDKSGFLTGLSLYDCTLYREIYKLRQELKLSTDHLEGIKNICKLYGWW